MQDTLKPRSSFGALKDVLCAREYNGDVDGMCSAIRSLCNGKIHNIRLIDMLYCKHEGDEDELKWRRRVIMDYLFVPLVKRSAIEPQMSKDHSELLVYFNTQLNVPISERRAGWKMKSWRS